jgi:tryptophan synthase alpha chain
VAPRLAAAFAAPRARRAALIPYFTGGWPDPQTSHRLVAEVIDAGVDVVELGVPFSDPIADGPVVQRSTHVALEAGVTPDDVLAIAAAHSRAVPFVLLAYLNTVLAYRPERFFSRAAAAGVEAVVIPDLPVEEMMAPARAAPLRPGASPAEAAPSLLELAAADGVALVPLAAPTSTDERLDLIAAAARAFVYCVAVTGVTGARTQVGSELPSLVLRLRRRTRTPLVAGFGISTPEQAAAAAHVADGVIMGSALIAAAAEALGAGGDPFVAAGALVRAAAAAIAD